MTIATTRQPRINPLVWAGAGALLSVPAIAMQLTDAVRWSGGDFLVFGAMLAAAAGGYEIVTRRFDRLGHRLGAAVAAFGCFLLVWVDLAVGIVGSANNPANWMYAGVLAVVVGGSTVARFRSGGMARTMLAAAGAQVLVAVVALALGLGIEGNGWPRDLIGITVAMAAIWLLAAVLFARADTAA